MGVDFDQNKVPESSPRFTFEVEVIFHIFFLFWWANSYEFLSFKKFPSKKKTELACIEKMVNIGSRLIDKHDNCLFNNIKG